MIKGKYYEEFKVGDKAVTPRKTITESAINVMLSVGGMRGPIFNDEVFAKQTNFGTCIAPGELTIVFMGGLNEQLEMFWDTVLIGIDKVSFKSPLKPGDTIYNEIEFISMRETSKPDMGLIVDRSTCKNQRGEVVCVLDFTHLVPRKPK